MKSILTTIATLSMTLLLSPPAFAQQGTVAQWQCVPCDDTGWVAIILQRVKRDIRMQRA